MVLAIIRNAVALSLLSGVLLYWLGDFNTYADIGGREYVIARPDSGRRLACSTGLGIGCGVAAGAAVWAVGRNWWGRWMALFVIFTALLFVVADLNLYVVGFGSEGQDWVKGRSEWDMERLLECGVMGGVTGAVACFVLWVATATQRPQPSSGGPGSGGPAAPSAARDAARISASESASLHPGRAGERCSWQ